MLVAPKDLFNPLRCIETAGLTISSLGGNQQFTTRNIIIVQSITGIYMIWDWGWTCKQFLVLIVYYISKSKPL